MILWFLLPELMNRSHQKSKKCKTESLSLWLFGILKQEAYGASIICSQIINDEHTNGQLGR